MWRNQVAMKALIHLDPATGGSAMAQQALDTLVADMEASRAPRQEPEPPSHLPGWRSIPQALIRAHGEEGQVDLAALDPARGVALVCFLEQGEEASPDEARDAFRAMLHEEGMEARFPGELPVVALAVPCAEREALAAQVEHAFAGLPRPSLPPGWVDWLAERLAPDRAGPSEEPLPRLVAPSDDAATLEKPAGDLVLAAAEHDPTPPEKSPASDLVLTAAELDPAPPEKSPGSDLVLVTAELDPAPPEKTPASVLDLEIEAPPEAVRARASLLDWGTSLGFAFGILAAMLVLLALVSHNGRLF